jgi:cytosine/adenosine deaminase-related metal-dependent hydrolase
MGTLLVKHIQTLITMYTQRRELRDGAIFVRDNSFEQVGLTSDLPATADEVLDLHQRYIVMPGLVNTHHHLYQSLTRVIPQAQNHELFDWLRALYPIWARLDSSAMYHSNRLGIAELLLSGCTTASDHHYIYPNDCKLDIQIQAAQEMGIRFHASRGSMSVGESQGGLPPDSVVEDEAFILKDSQRLIETYHNAERYSMLRITLAPCSPFSVSIDLMRESAAMARAYSKVRLHTHLAETKPDVEYSLAHFGLIPGDYAESVGWLGDDVWHAHCVYLSDNAIQKFGQTGTGVAHCPSSNLRLASGIAPIRHMLDHHVPVGLGVDGSASNDSGHLLSEARMALLCQRAHGNPAALTAREALELGTLGGAKVLGRDDIGSIAPTMAADFIAFNVDTPAFAGAHHDIVAALVFCTPPTVDYSVINGKFVIKEGRLMVGELSRIIEDHNRAAIRLVNED